jgi:hypothetical protein
MDLGWYWNRLRSMSAPEIAHRFVEQAKKSQSRRMTEGWRRFSSDVITAVPVLPGLAEAVDAAPAALREDAARAAADFMSGRFTALGVTWPTFTMADAQASIWHLDPVTGRHWPSDRYCFDVSYRGATEMGDVKYAWEFSRLQFLQPLALDARLSGNAEALGFIERAIASWHASNLPFKGIGWSSGIELGLRVISLLVVTSLIGDQLSISTQQRIEEMLHSHAYWLARYPSRFSSANNHLIAEAAALYLIGATCPFVRNAERLKMRAEAVLVREAQLQIHADGVAAEQSPTYGALTSELLLLCAFVGKHSGASMPDIVATRLAAFAEWIFWLAEPSGIVPAIGDDDEGRVLTLGQEEPGYATSVAAVIASFTGHGDRVPSHTPTLRNTLAPPAAPASAPTGTRKFLQGGYTVHRVAASICPAVTLVIDHAQLGYLAIAAHGHADALSFTLAVDGKALFVDPGTYLYHSGYQWRDWFRNTRAHNTVSVEGAEQSIISGAFNWSHKAQTRLDRLEIGSETLVVASHDGYKGRFGVRHVRDFTFTDNELVLHDALLGGPDRKAEIVLQLAPDCEVMAEGDALVVRRASERIARIMFPSNGTVTQTRGEDRIDGGWVSPHFGVKVPATRLAWHGTIGVDGVSTRIMLTDVAGACHPGVNDAPH